MVWAKWCEELNTTSKVEAEDTLQEENLSFEFGGMFKTETGYYAYIFTEGEAVPGSTDIPINAEHRRVKKECFESAEEVSIGYLLTNKT